jgi:UDP-N-acetylglucosamine acyltransferase
VVTRDVPPFAKSFGNPARVQGVNTVGMTRQGLDVADAERLAELYASGTDLSVDWPAPDALRPALDWWWARASAA